MGNIFFYHIILARLPFYHISFSIWSFYVMSLCLYEECKDSCCSTKSKWINEWEVHMYVWALYHAIFCEYSSFCFPSYFVHSVQLFSALNPFLSVLHVYECFFFFLSLYLYLFLPLDFQVLFHDYSCFGVVLNPTSLVS